MKVFTIGRIQNALTFNHLTIKETITMNKDLIRELGKRGISIYKANSKDIKIAGRAIDKKNKKYENREKN